MKNKQILKKAIKKAVKNGWKANVYVVEENIPFDSWTEEEIRHLIFNHHFAKAFWGEELLPLVDRKNYMAIDAVPNWQYHFQKLVLQEKPLKYLEKFLKQ